MGVGFESLMRPGTQRLIKDSCHNCATTKTTCGGDAVSISFCWEFFPYLALKGIYTDLQLNYWHIWVYIQDDVCVNIGIVGVYVRLNNAL